MIQTQELENEKNLVLDNIRELNGVPVTNLYTLGYWFILY